MFLIAVDLLEELVQPQSPQVFSLCLRAWSTSGGLVVWYWWSYCELTFGLILPSFFTGSALEHLQLSLSFCDFNHLECGQCPTGQLQGDLASQTAWTSHSMKPSVNANHILFQLAACKNRELSCYYKTACPLGSIKAGGSSMKLGGTLNGSLLLSSLHYSTCLFSSLFYSALLLSSLLYSNLPELLYIGSIATKFPLIKTRCTNCRA